MFSTFKRGLLGLGFGAGLVLSACASNGTPQSALAPAPQGLSCAKCQVTYINAPTKVGKTIVGYHKQGVMECPGCKDEVASFFTTGKFQHTCKVCGGEMSICEAHT